MFHIHAHAATVFEYHSLDAIARRIDDQIQPAFLPIPPDIGWFPAQGGFIEVSLIHGGNYILHLSLPHAKILLHDELITEHIEKWATPTFLLVIRKIRSNTHVKE